MIDYIRKNHIKILIIGGIVFANVLALISTICEMPKGDVLNIIGAYVGIVSISTGTFLFGMKIIRTKKIFGVLLIFLSLVITVGVIVSLFKLFLKLS